MQIQSIFYFNLYQGILPKVNVQAKFTRSVLCTRILWTAETEKTVFVAFIARYGRNKLFEFSRDTNGEELKIRKSTVTLQWSCCNDFFAMASVQRFHLSRLCMFLIIDNRLLYTGKFRLFVKDP